MRNEIVIHPDVIIGLDAEWLICDDVCIPESGYGQLSLLIDELPVQSKDYEHLYSIRKRLPTVLSSPLLYTVKNDVFEIEIPRDLFPGASRFEFYPYKNEDKETIPQQKSNLILNSHLGV